MDVRLSLSELIGEPAALLLPLPAAALLCKVGIQKNRIRLLCCPDVCRDQPGSRMQIPVGGESLQSNGGIGHRRPPVQNLIQDRVFPELVHHLCGIGILCVRLPRSVFLQLLLRLSDLSLVFLPSLFPGGGLRSAISSKLRKIDRKALPGGQEGGHLSRRFSERICRHVGCNLLPDGQSPCIRCVPCLQEGKIRYGEAGEALCRSQPGRILLKQCLAVLRKNRIGGKVRDQFRLLPHKSLSRAGKERKKEGQAQGQDQGQGNGEVSSAMAPFPLSR